MPARVSREMMAICGSDSTATGRIRFSSAPLFHPAVGTQPSLEANTSCNSGAVTNVGMHTPRMAMAMVP